MCIDVANTEPSEVASVDELQYLRVLSPQRLWQPDEGAEHPFWLAKGAKSQLSDHKRMCQYGVIRQKRDELLVRGPKMVDPDGCVDQDH
jgi:hypothetical protein